MAGVGLVALLGLLGTALLVSADTSGTIGLTDDSGGNLVTSDTVMLCKEGTWADMKSGCNAFLPSLVPNPGWFASIFSEETPEIGLGAALVGEPES